MNEPVRRWGASTKRIVALIVLVLLALLLHRFRVVITPLVIAILMAFVLNPAVDFLVGRLHFPRSVAATLVFLVLIALLLGLVAAPVTAVPSVRRAVRSVEFDLTHIINDIGAFFERPVEIWEYQLDLSEVYQELSTAVRSFVRSVAQGTLDVVFGIASGALWLIFIFIAAFYLVKDTDHLIQQFDLLAPPGYGEDFVRLRRQIGAVWHAFLRGQLVLSLAMVAITAVVCTAVGLPYAWVLGLLAGVMEFVPSIGAVIAAIPAILLALFEGSAFLPLSNFWFAVLVAGLYILIQQIEGNLLIPRILGRSLNLHPLVVLIAIIIGGSLAGILGMLLAAPLLATLRVIGRYIFCRLYDRDPFPEPEKEPPSPKPGRLDRLRKAVSRWLRKKGEQSASGSDPASAGDR